MTKTGLGFLGALLLACCALHLTACGSSDDLPASAGTTAAPPTVRIAASESVLPLMNLLVHDVAETDSQQRPTLLLGMHSSGAVAATAEGEADIGVLSRLMSPDEQSLGLHYLHLALDWMVFATHSDVQVQDLTSEQVRRIYSGEITNWKELGGDDATIVVLDRPDHTSPKIAMRKGGFGGDPAVAENTIILERPGQMLVSLGSLEHSIGYASLPEILFNGLDVNVLSLDGVAPTPRNVEDGLYPLVRHIGIVIRPRPDAESMRFIDFAYGDVAEEIMRSHGYSPVLMTLVIAMSPERIPIRQEERYRPLADHLSSTLGDRTSVSLRHLPSYEDLVSEFLSGDVNAAFFGSFAYAQVRAKVGVVPVARPETDGNSQYRGLIFARKDSGITEWSDLQGRSFSMIRDTTAGDVFPRVFLRRHGIANHENFLGTIFYAGSHDVSVRRVLSGEIDAGAAKDLVFNRLAREDPRVAEELVILARSLPVPENALVLRDNVNVACISCHQQTAGGMEHSGDSRLREFDLAGRLREELLGLERTAEGRKVLEALGADRFVETTDADYAHLYQMIDELWLRPAQP